MAEQLNNCAEQNINISIVRGGFVLRYPEIITSLVDGSEQVFNRVEVFTSANKMKKRIAEVLETFKLTSES